MIIYVWDKKGSSPLDDPSFMSTDPTKIKIISDGTFIIKEMDDGISISADDRIEIRPVASNMIVVRDTNYE